MKARIFRQFCKAMDTQHKCLILQKQVWQLSMGRVWFPVLEAEEGILIFMRRKWQFQKKVRH